MSFASTDNEFSVLVIDDNYIIAMDVAAILVRRRYRVLGPASCIDDALTMLERELPDLAVMDVRLRGQSAFPVAEALHKANVPFIVMSSFPPSAWPFDVLQSARNIGKPVGENALISALVAAAHAATVARQKRADLTAGA